MLGLKTNRAFAGLVVPQLGFELVHRAARIEGAVSGSRAKPGDHAPIEAKRRNPIADALFSARKGGPDRPPQAIECRPLFWTYGHKVLVDRLWLVLCRFHHMPIAGSPKANARRSVRTVDRRCPVRSFQL